jgi:hypothetical protein
MGFVLCVAVLPEIFLTGKKLIGMNQSSPCFQLGRNKDDVLRILFAKAKLYFHCGWEESRWVSDLLILGRHEKYILGCCSCFSGGFARACYK